MSENKKGQHNYFDPNSKLYQAIDTATPPAPFFTVFKLGRILECLHHADPKGNDAAVVTLVDSDLQYLYEALKTINDHVSASLEADRGAAEYGELLEDALCLSWGTGKPALGGLDSSAT